MCFCFFFFLHTTLHCLELRKFSKQTSRTQQLGLEGHLHSKFSFKFIIIVQFNFGHCTSIQKKNPSRASRNAPTKAGDVTLLGFNFLVRRLNIITLLSFFFFAFFAPLVVGCFLQPLSSVSFFGTPCLVDFLFFAGRWPLFGRRLLDHRFSHWCRFLLFFGTPCRLVLVFSAGKWLLLGRRLLANHSGAVAWYLSWPSKGGREFAFWS